jgi:hypothetical protein
VSVIDSSTVCLCKEEQIQIVCSQPKFAVVHQAAAHQYLHLHRLAALITQVSPRAATYPLPLHGCASRILLHVHYMHIVVMGTALRLRKYAPHLCHRFRIPPYYTLLVRSLSVLEGIALASDPNYKVGL